jgi:hypothetical protein
MGTRRWVVTGLACSLAIGPVSPAAHAQGFAVPRASCGPGSHVEAGLQGEVPRWDPTFLIEGYHCNLDLVGHFSGDGANAQMAWYGDCAYMSTLYAPFDPEFDALKGTVVLDMSDPAHPVRTAKLQTRAMVSPHESLKVNVARGLLAATEGGAGPTSPLPVNFTGLLNSGPYFDVYDVATDCRHPRLLSTVALPHGSGHEGDFAPDGMTYYESTIESPPLPAIIPIDITDPAQPREIMQWPRPASLDTRAGFHGLKVSDDGYTGYFMAQGGPDNGLAIVDLSDVQHRVPDPDIRLVGHVRWNDGDVVQIGVPATIDGHPYVIASEEFGTLAVPAQACAEGLPPFGYLHVVDIADPSAPAVVSKIPLEVTDPANCPITLPEHTNPTPVTYSSHYCNVDDPLHTTAVACTWLGSGLRVFDVRDPMHPKEIAYLNPRPNPTAIRGSQLKTAVIVYPGQDVCGSDVRWIQEPGGAWALWFMCTQSGVTVARFANGAYPLEGS